MLSGTCLPFKFPPCNSIGLPLSNTYLARELLDIFRFARLYRPRRAIPTSRTSDLQEGPSYMPKIKNQRIYTCHYTKVFSQEDKRQRQSVTCKFPSPFYRNTSSSLPTCFLTVVSSFWQRSL